MLSKDRSETRNSNLRRNVTADVDRRYVTNVSAREIDEDVAGWLTSFIPSSFLY